MKVTVVGLGSFGGGVGATRYFAERGHEVCVTDLRGPDELRASLEALADLSRVRYVLGRHEERDVEEADIVVASPAVPAGSALLRRAAGRGIEVTTELEVFLRACPSPALAVTGTNGKTTTAHMLFEILAAAGHQPAMAGNMGRSLLPQVERLSPEHPVVVEISSFQLERLAPGPPLFDGAVVTPITPDHLDRHGTFASYVEAKLRVADFLAPGSPLVVDAACRHAESFAARAGHARVIRLSGAGGVPVPRRLLGAFNHAHLARAAALAAAVCGVGLDAVASVADEVRPRPHRLEPVCRRGGVLYVDDSKATTPASCAAAVSAFDAPVRLLAGGRDKGVDAAPMLAAMASCASVHLFGETGPRLASALPAGVGHSVDLRLAEACARARSAARAGDVVLLSPGHPSYDAFRDYRERGAAFRRLVS